MDNIKFDYNHIIISLNTKDDSEWRRFVSLGDMLYQINYIAIISKKI